MDLDDYIDSLERSLTPEEGEKYTARQIIAKFNEHGWKEEINECTNNKHVFLKGKYHFLITHTNIREYDDGYPLIKLYSNDVLLTSSGSDIFEEVHSVFPEINPTAFTKLIEKETDIYNELNEYFVNKALKNLEG